MMENSLEGHELSVAVITSRFNENVTQKLEDGAMDALIQQGRGTSEYCTIYSSRCV